MNDRLTVKQHLIALAAVTAWCLVMAFSYCLNYYESNLHRGREVDYFQVLLPYLVSCGSWIPLTPLMLFLSQRFPFHRGRWIGSLGVQILAGLLLGSLKSIITYVAYQNVSFGYDVPMWGFGQALFGCLTYATFLLFHNCLRIYQHYKSRRLAAVQLEAQLTRAQLQVLKMQLHPHFLFNTLHNIASLNLHDVKAANRMISRLSDLLRISLENIEVQEVSLKEELDFVNLYLGIEKVRFSDRLVVKQDIDPEALDARVPNMILQPIVENAIQHGISRTEGLGRITLRAERRADGLRIEVLDNGPGLQEAGSKNGSGSSLGLSNTAARIQQIYGARGRFEISSREMSGCRVRLSLPYNNRPEEEKAWKP